MLNIAVEFDGRGIVDLTEGKISLLTRSVASKVRAAVQESTPKKTGTTAKAWTPVRKDEGGYSFSNPLVQSYFLEYGSEAGKRPWPRANLRTVYTRGRVYSSQAPEGITALADVEALAQRVATQLMEELIAEKVDGKE